MIYSQKVKLHEIYHRNVALALIQFKFPFSYRVTSFMKNDRIMSIWLEKLEKLNEILQCLNLKLSRAVECLGKKNKRIA